MIESMLPGIEVVVDRGIVPAGTWYPLLSLFSWLEPEAICAVMFPRAVLVLAR
jgi:hypothetical protein